MAEQELISAEEARKETLKQYVKKLDDYIRKEIRNGRTSRHFDFTEPDDSIILKNWDQVISHFKSKGYEVEQWRGFNQYIDQRWAYEHPFRRPKTIDVLEGCLDIKW